MNTQKIDAVEVLKEFEDVLAPRLKLSVLDRAVYSHLFRHTHLEGKRRLRFAILWLAKNMGVRGKSVRTAVRRLIHKGALRLIERSNKGHLVEVRLPSEVRAPRPSKPALGQDQLPGGAVLDEMGRISIDLLQPVHLAGNGRHQLYRLRERRRPQLHAIRRLHLLTLRAAKKQPRLR